MLVPSLSVPWENEGCSSASTVRNASGMLLKPQVRMHLL